MKKLVSISAIAILFSMIFVSCDKIDGPYVRKKTGNDTTSTAVRKILIEEFTGHKCPNCPAGALIGKELKETYPNQVILLTIHAGMFAIPDAVPSPIGDFTYDFRTAAGNELHDFFKIDAYPSGMISRIKSGPEKFQIGSDYWASTVDTMLNDVPQAGIEISTSYDAGLKKVTATVKTTFLDDLEGDYNLCVFLTEDSIVKPQKNQDPPVGPTPVIQNYVHMHVLRQAFNGTWGENIASGVVVNGATVTKTYSLILGTDLVPKNCHVVAYIYGGTDDMPNKYEILQAEEKSIF